MSDLRSLRSLSSQALMGSVGPQPYLEVARRFVGAGGADDEVRWRVDAMRPQMTSEGPIPLLIARSVAGGAEGSCCSCGGPLEDGQRFRCGWCLAAVVQILEASG